MSYYLLSLSAQWRSLENHFRLYSIQDTASCRHCSVFTPPMSHLAGRRVEICAQVRGAICKPDTRCCVSGPESSSSHPVPCGAAKTLELQAVLRFPSTRITHRLVPLNSVSFCSDSRRCAAMMMACGLAVAQPAASLAPSGKRSLSGGRPPWLPSPRLFSGKFAFRWAAAFLFIPSWS